MKHTPSRISTHSHITPTDTHLLSPVGLRRKRTHSLGCAGACEQASPPQLQALPPAALLQQLGDGQRLDDRLAQPQAQLPLWAGLALRLQAQVHGLLGLRDGQVGLGAAAVAEVGVLQGADVFHHPVQEGKRQGKR